MVVTELLKVFVLPEKNSKEKNKFIASISSNQSKRITPRWIHIDHSEPVCQLVLLCCLCSDCLFGQLKWELHILLQLSLISV